MDNIIATLENIQRTHGNFLAGVTGAIFGVILESARYARDAIRIFNNKFESLAERVVKIEKGTTATPSVGQAGLSAAELATLGTGSIGTPASNVTVGLKSYTSGDKNNVAFHSLTFTASGAVSTAAALVAVTFPSPLPSARCPEFSLCPGYATYAGAEKPIAIVPSFNSLNQCTGYAVWARIALASGDVRDFSVRVRDLP